MKTICTYNGAVPTPREWFPNARASWDTKCGWNSSVSFRFRGGMASTGARAGATTAQIPPTKRRLCRPSVSRLWRGRNKKPSESRTLRMSPSRGGGGCPEYQCPRGDSYGGVVAGPDPENQRSAVFGPRWDTNTPNLTGSRQRGRNEGPLCNKPARPAPCGEARNRWDRAARTTPTVWRVDGGTEAISAQDPIEFRCCCFFFGEGRRRVRTDTQLWRRRVIPQNHREQSSGFAHPTPDTECPGMFQSLSQLF
jgi:hypothetical protein